MHNNRKGLISGGTKDQYITPKLGASLELFTLIDTYPAPTVHLWPRVPCNQLALMETYLVKWRSRMGTSVVSDIWIPN
jgi:hypothetical protein